METTEQKPLTDEERRGLYDAEKRRAGRFVIETDKATYARHLVEVMELYRDPKPGYFKRCIAEVERRCAKTSGFPEYTNWSPK